MEPTLNVQKEKEQVIRQLVPFFKQFISDYPDQERVIQVLYTFDHERFDKYWVQFTLDRIDDFGFGNGIHCPECGSPFENGLCECMKRKMRNHKMSEYLLQDEEHSEYYKRRHNDEP